MRHRVEEGGAHGPFLGPREDREAAAHRDHRADDDEHLVLEDAGALDLAALLNAVGGPLQARPHDRHGEQRRPEGELRQEVHAGVGDVLLDPAVVVHAAVDDAGEVVHCRRELVGRRAQELHQQDDHQEGGGAEHEPLQAHVVLEAGHQEGGHRRCAHDADDDVALCRLAPDRRIDEARAVVVHAEPHEQRRHAERGEQPARERHPLDDPDDEAAHDDREADRAAEHAALEHVVAAGARHGGRHPHVGEGDRKLEQDREEAGLPHGHARERRRRPHERPREDDPHGQEVVHERRPGRHHPGQPRSLSAEDFGLCCCCHRYPPDRFVCGSPPDDVTPPAVTQTSSDSRSPCPAPA